MKALRVVLTVVSLLLLSTLLLTAQTLDEVLSKYYEARGGLDRIKSVQTIQISGKMMMQGLELPMEIMGKRPNHMRSQITLQGQVITSAFDGTTGWMINPMTGSPDPIDIPSEQLKSIKEQADFDGLLVEWKEKGHTVELVGKEDIEGAEAYHLKVTTKDGDDRHIYLDADSYLEIQTKGKYPAQGKEIEVTASLGSYKMVDSMMIAHAVESRVEGRTFQQMVLDSIKFNIDVPDSLFVRPAATK